VLILVPRITAYDADSTGALAAASRCCLLVIDPRGRQTDTVTLYRRSLLEAGVVNKDIYLLHNENKNKTVVEEEHKMAKQWKHKITNKHV